MPNEHNNWNRVHDFSAPEVDSPNWKIIGITYCLQVLIIGEFCSSIFWGLFSSISCFHPYPPQYLIHLVKCYIKDEAQYLDLSHFLFKREFNDRVAQLDEEEEIKKEQLRESGVTVSL